MKKITILVACLTLFITKGYAQFPEGFEGTEFPPSGWTTFIGTNGAGTAQNWQRSTGDSNTGQASAFVRWDSTAPGTPKEDWLVTPQFTVTAEAPSLLFYQRQTYTFEYSNTYAIKVSTTSQTDIASFTDVLVQSEADVPMTFGPKMIDMSAYIGQQIYVAFVNTNDNGDDWYVDDVSMTGVVEVPGCASNPVPVDAATNIPVGEYTFSWDAPTTGDPATIYNIYAGVDPDNLQLLGTWEETSVTFLLEDYETTFYWSAVPANAGGEATGCPVWSFTTESAPGYCLSAPNGQYPFGEEGYTPETCDGVTINEITDIAYSGEYSVVNVVEGETYTFISGTTDFVTIAPLEGNTSYGAGDSPLTWVSTLTGQVRFFSHNNDQCEHETEFRVRSVICGVVSDETPDYVNLQYPAAETITEGGSVTVYGQVYEGGLTDVEPGLTGQAEGIQMWVGVSADNTDPSTWTPDAWTQGVWNEFASVSNNDEYMATIGQNLDPGTYYFATRFRLNDGGFVYGGTDGTNGNFWDGTTYNSGVLTVLPAPAPENDECDGAIVLTPGADFAAGALATTNLGATTGNTLPTCQSNVASNVWYSVVVPESGSITLETNSLGGSSFFDSVMAVYSGECGSLTQIACNDDGGDELFSLVSLSGRTPGEVLYVSVWNYSFEFSDSTEGNFQISAYDASLTTAAFAGGAFAYYPNPVKEILNLSATNELASAQVFNLMGQRVMQANIGSTEGQLDLSALPRGAYMVRVFSGNAEKTIKIIKE